MRYSQFTSEVVAGEKGLWLHVRARSQCCFSLLAAPLGTTRDSWVIPECDSDVCRFFALWTGAEVAGALLLERQRGLTSQYLNTLFHQLTAGGRGARRTGLLCLCLIFTDCKWQLLMVSNKRRSLGAARRGTSPELRASVMIYRSRSRQSGFLGLEGFIEGSIFKINEAAKRWNKLVFENCCSSRPLAFPHFHL